MASSQQYTYYKLLSEVTIPSAVNDKLVTVNNLSMPFFAGSFVGAFIKSPGKDYEFINIMIRNVENIPMALLFRVTSYVSLMSSAKE